MSWSWVLAIIWMNGIVLYPSRHPLPHWREWSESKIFVSFFFLPVFWWIKEDRQFLGPAGPKVTTTSRPTPTDSADYDDEDEDYEDRFQWADRALFPLFAIEHQFSPISKSKCTGRATPMQSRPYLRRADKNQPRNNPTLIDRQRSSFNEFNTSVHQFFLLHTHTHKIVSDHVSRLLNKTLMDDKRIFKDLPIPLCASFLSSSCILQSTNRRSRTSVLDLGAIVLCCLLEAFRLINFFSNQFLPFCFPFLIPPINYQKFLQAMLVITAVDGKLKKRTLKKNAIEKRNTREKRIKKKSRND